MSAHDDVTLFLRARGLADESVAAGAEGLVLRWEQAARDAEHERYPFGVEDWLDELDLGTGAGRSDVVDTQVLGPHQQPHPLPRREARDPRHDGRGGEGPRRQGRPGRGARRDRCSYRPHEAYKGLAEADSRVDASTELAGACLWGAKMAKRMKWSPREHWWYWRRPRVVADDFEGGA